MYFVILALCVTLAAAEAQPAKIARVWFLALQGRSLPHGDAVLILEEPVLGVHATKIAELAAKDHLPTMFPPSRVAAGGLIAYGTSQVQAIHRMAAYVDKVLKGTKPGTLPVDAVTQYELFVNLKTAKQIGVTVPADVLKRANQVIQ